MMPAEFITKLNFKKQPEKSSAHFFAPTNIALIKYWGKRDSGLNLPVTSSLSVTLPRHGTITTLTLSDAASDQLILNGKSIAETTSFYQKTKDFINLFRYHDEAFIIETKNNIPTAAGLASSASGFAALTLALNDIYQWHLSLSQCSLLARMGSGSACRSFWNGFVYWEKGNASDGHDSYAMPLSDSWPNLCIGLNLISSIEKPISSRDAMNLTVATSPFYSQWPALVEENLANITTAIHQKDFLKFGQLAESNAIAMHATMQTAWPPIYYSTDKTFIEMQKVWALRQNNIPVFFTQDAGANLKLI